MGKVLLAFIFVSLAFDASGQSTPPISSGNLKKLCEEQGARPELGKNDSCRQFVTDEEKDRETATEGQKAKDLAERVLK